MVRRFTVVALLAFCSAAAGAQPRFELTSTTKSAQKGHVFGILLHLQTDAALTDVAIEVTPPENFCVAPDSQSPWSGQRAASGNRVVIPTIAAASELTIPFRVVTPNQFMVAGESCAGGKRTTYDAMGDEKVFVFNFSYLAPGEPSPRQSSRTIAVKYTTSNGIFLTAGMIGVFLGFIVKLLTKGRAEGGGLSRVGVLRELPLLVTSLVIGLGALLGIADKGLPSSGFISALATGIGLGILSDESLISKVKPSSPRAKEA